MASKVEEFQLGDKETTDFLNYAQRYARHYNVATNQKAIDAIVFYGFAISMGTTRLIAYRTRIATERQKGQPATVTNFPRPFTVHEQAPPPIIQPDFTSELGGDDSAA